MSNTVSVWEGIYLLFNIHFSCCPMQLLSRKFPHTQLQLYRYSNTKCCTVPCMAFIDVLWYVTFFTPLRFCTPLKYLSPFPPYSIPNHVTMSTVQSRTVQWPTAQHSTALLVSAVPLYVSTHRCLPTSLYSESSSASDAYSPAAVSTSSFYPATYRSPHPL